MTGILQLADQGRLILDDPIGKYVDGVPVGDEITLRELAHMQSGLFNYTGSDAFWRMLSDYVRDHITAPLGMSHTTFAATGAYPEPHARGYPNLTVDGTTAVATDWNPSWSWAAGAVISNLEDMQTWAPALASGKLLSPQMQAQRLQTVIAPPNPRTTVTASGCSSSAAGSATTAACPRTRPRCSISP